MDKDIFKTMNLEQQLDLLTDLPILASLKDLHSRTIWVTNHVAQLCGLKNADQMQGMSDYDLPSPVSAEADEFARDEQLVASSRKEISGLGLYHYGDSDWRLLCYKRIPIFNKSKTEVTAILVNAIEMNHSQLINPMILLQKLDRKHHPSDNLSQFSYTLSDQYSNTSLSERESECYFHLLRGKSAKQIGKLMLISNRTVEAHIEKIKLKLNCKAKSELFDYAYTNNLINVIPQKIFNNLISKDTL